MEQLWQTTKTHGYYIVKWDRPLKQFQEDTDIFQAGYEVFNDKYLNLIQQSNNWYSQSTIKTVFHVQHFLADNLYLQIPLLSIKIPNTCDRSETVQKGAMKLHDRLHKFILDEIIHRGALDFIGHDKDGHQDKE